MIHPFPQHTVPKNGGCFKPTRHALPQEPTLISKVRIHFADFPYSHCSNWSEAFNLGDLLRITVRSRTESEIQTAGFLCMLWRSAQTEVCPAASSASRSLVYAICGTQKLPLGGQINSVREKSKFFRSHHNISPAISALQLEWPRKALSIHGTGILACFPFLVSRMA